MLACEGFPCEVYTCRLGTNTTDRSTLTYHRDETGETFATLRCFKLLDDFDETGCREWDRLELNRDAPTVVAEVAVPTLNPGRDTVTTPTWKTRSNEGGPGSSASSRRPRGNRSDENARACENGHTTAAFPRVATRRVF